MLFAVTALMSACNTNNTTTSVTLENNIDSVSYAIGSNLGANIRRQMEGAGDANLSYNSMIFGFTQGLNKEDLVIDETEATDIINTYLAAKDEEKRATEAAKFSANADVETAFFAENALKEGVIQTETGLQYLIVTKGTGDLPIDGDRVNVNYEGTLLSGEVFDSSYERGAPIEFDINRVIPGWTEGLKLMPVGSKFIFFIPSQLGYSANPPPNSIIEPYSTLVFTVELLGIVK